MWEIVTPSSICIGIRWKKREVRMSRQFAGLLHVCIAGIGYVTGSSLLATAARVYGWSEDYKDLLVGLCFLAASVLQGLLGWVSQAYNVDGTLPGTVPQTTVHKVVQQPGEGPTETTTVTEPVTRKTE
jgi:hypothetical protein